MTSWRVASARSSRCQPSGGVLFECDKNEAIFVVLPIADRAPFVEIAKLAMLAKAMKMKPVNLRYHVKLLVGSRQVLATGNTADRRLSLP